MKQDRSQIKTAFSPESRKSISLNLVSDKRESCVCLGTVLWCLSGHVCIGELGCLRVMFCGGLHVTKVVGSSVNCGWHSSSFTTILHQATWSLTTYFIFVPRCCLSVVPIADKGSSAGNVLYLIVFGCYVKCSKITTTVYY